MLLRGGIESHESLSTGPGKRCKERIGWAPRAEPWGTPPLPSPINDFVRQRTHSVDWFVFSQEYRGDGVIFAVACVPPRPLSLQFKGSSLKVAQQHVFTFPNNECNKAI